MNQNEDFERPDACSTESDAAALQTLRALPRDTQAALVNMTSAARLGFRLGLWAGLRSRTTVSFDDQYELRLLANHTLERVIASLAPRHQAGARWFTDTDLWRTFASLVAILPRLAPSRGNPLGGEDELDAVPVAPFVEQYAHKGEATRHAWISVIQTGDYVAAVFAAAGRTRPTVVDSLPPPAISEILPAHVLQMIQALAPDDDAWIELLAFLHAKWTGREPTHAPGPQKLLVSFALFEACERRGDDATRLRQFIADAELWQLPALAEALTVDRVDAYAVQQYIATVGTQLYPVFQAGAGAIIAAGKLGEHIRSMRP